MKSRRAMSISLDAREAEWVREYAARYGKTISSVIEDAVHDRRVADRTLRTISALTIDESSFLAKRQSR